MNKQAGRQALRVMGKARVYNQWLVDLVRPFLGERVLEVGAGMGNMSELLVGEAAVLTVCDVEGEYLGVLRRKLGEGVAVKRVDLAGSREQLPREGFDTVLCFNVLEHVRGEKRAIENMRYWLKEGGRLLLLVPAHAWLYSELDRKLGHVRRYARREVEEILRGTGWREVKVGYVNWIGALGWWLVVKMMKWGRVPRGGMGMFGAGGFLFRWAVAIESFLKLPFGLSVLAVAKK